MSAWSDGGQFMDAVVTAATWQLMSYGLEGSCCHAWRSLLLKTLSAAPS